MRLLLTAVLAVALAAGVAYFAGLWEPFPTLSQLPEGSKDSVSETVDYGEPLYKAAPDPAPTNGPIGPAKVDPLVIPGLHLVIFDKQKVPSQRDGVLLFVGQEVDKDAAAKPGKHYTVSVNQAGT